MKKFSTLFSFSPSSHHHQQQQQPPLQQLPHSPSKINSATISSPSLTPPSLPALPLTPIKKNDPPTNTYSSTSIHTTPLSTPSLYIETTLNSSIPVFLPNSSSFSSSSASSCSSVSLVSSIHSTFTSKVSPLSSFRSPSLVIETQEIKKSIDTLSGSKMLNQYVFIKKLGKGVHGKVKLAKNLESQKLVAIKILRKEPPKGRRHFSPSSCHPSSFSSLSASASKLVQVGLDSSHSSSSSSSSSTCSTSSTSHAVLADPDVTTPFTMRSSLSNWYLYPQLEKIKREIAILKKCKHPNIVELYEVIDHPSSRKVYIVLEYLAGGELLWQSENKPCLPLSNIPSIFRDVIVGLEYLHTQGIIHRDLKPANLLTTECGRVKLSDFGVSYFSQRQLENEQKILSQRRAFMRSSNLSSSTKSSWLFSNFKSSIPISSTPLDFFHHKEEEEEEEAKETKKKEEEEEEEELKEEQEEDDPNAEEECMDEELIKTVGSPAFLAPELCHFQPDELHERRNPKLFGISKAIDVWALGVTLYCLCFGVCPFTAESEYKLLEAISTQPLIFPSDIPVPPDLIDLISRILTKDPHQRPTLDQIKRHPWTLQGLVAPERWLTETDPIHYELVHVTEEDVNLALTHAVGKLKHQLRRLSSSFQSFTFFHSQKSRSQSLNSVSALGPFSLPNTSTIPSSPLLSSTSSSPTSYQSHPSSSCPCSPTPSSSSSSSMHPPSSLMFTLSPIDPPRELPFFSLDSPAYVQEGEGRITLEHKDHLQNDTEKETEKKDEKEEKERNEEEDPEEMERRRRSTWENDLGLMEIDEDERIIEVDENEELGHAYSHCCLSTEKEQCLNPV